MKMKKAMSLMLGLQVAGLAVWAEGNPTDGLLKGRILDREKNPLPGAVVVLDGSRRSVLADADGFYSFAGLAAGQHRLKVSYLGFQPVDRVVSDRKSVV